jgi:localization factor PodJL
MKFGFASSVKGIRPEARETAQEAARRAGLPLNEWLNAVILQQAAEQGIAPALARTNSSSDDLSKVNMRLDEIARRIDQVTRGGPTAYAPKRHRNDAEQMADLVARLEQCLGQFTGAQSPPAPLMPSVQLPPSLDNAIAEITARRRALNGVSAQPRTTAGGFATSEPISRPVPTQDLSGLENQLRQITNQIETLRRPGMEEAIQAVRAELVEIGRTLNEAMPRRAIEAIERQIQDLSGRIAEGRQAGVDGGALAGIERGLADVRDALRGLMPAETLVGYNEAIDALAHKIDLIVAQKDPATLQRLENSITTLREMATHVASNETMSALGAQVKLLSDKVDRLAVDSGATDALNNLEQRIDALSRSLADRSHAGEAVPPRLETLVQSLSDKIDLIQQSRNDAVAFGHLEDRIVKLVQRLDSSDVRLGQLDAIERGLADLLVHVEDIRASRETPSVKSDSAPHVDVLKQDIVRAQDAVDSMHGTLGSVVDRLTTIEQNIRDGRQKPPTPESDIVELIQTVRAGPVTDAPSIVPQAPTAAQAPASAPLAVVGTAGPADQPLEPGSGPPRLGNPGARIAASEAALGSARPNVTPPGGKSDFIAAARRAAQAAAQDPKSRAARPDASKTTGDTSLRAKMMTRVKSLFLAASIVAIVAGSIQFTGNIFDFGFFEPTDAKLTRSAETANNEITTSVTGQDAAAITIEQPVRPFAANPPPPIPAADAAALAKLFSPPALPSLTPAPPTPAPAAEAPPLDLSPSAQEVSTPPANTSVPVLGTTSAPKNDVTGSITRPSTEAKASKPSGAPATQPVPTERLPASIGGTRLRNAALVGDSAAAYEVAMRYAEGRGVTANLEEAARWFERAASKGLTPAQFRYASMLEKGQGVKKDLTAAHKLYVAAAGKGHAKAMHNLAVLYAEGAEGKPDYASAAQWFRKAAEHGVPDSQYNLGVLTARGLGTERNIAESYKWFALAAAQGDRDAGRKRDEVATHLDARTLSAAQQAVKNFVAEPQPPEAIAIPEPAGGWDRTTPPSPEKPKAASSGPLSTTAFESGKL